MTDNLKNVVIVGASSAGSTAARALSKKLPATHRVVLIDAAESAFWPISSLRAAVVSGWEDKTFVPLEGFFGPADKTRHIVRPSTKVIEVTNSDVLVQTPTGQEERIGFEYAILATGSAYPVPARPASAKTLEAKAALTKLQADVKAAKHILIVGGGEVGVEFAGEVASAYSHAELRKQITLVSRGTQLVGKDNPAGLSKSLDQQLQKSGVKVLLGDSVDVPKDTKNGLLGTSQSFTSKNGVEISDVDFVLVATGTSPVADLWAHADPDSIVDGQAKVNSKTLRAESTVLTNWFAAGDVAKLPGSKTHVNAQGGANTAAANIISLVQGGKGNAKSFAPTNICVVPLGTSGGASNMFGWTIGGFLTSLIKGKTLFVSQFHGAYKP
ncbi:hypothetical protein OC846_001324 [Tilletia horrida]|uniref:FAD/NAD(P)-binding domain-containing protein n=1 Tax=Tilletia horrida TaxID=155126 RepID=A0AAN6GWL4_9BASI|nr:hypothetical protein OC845_001222 [Tilletia horrida]KAK0556229.1 hypothetical protein OC846_001324 [Tilletia horrida]KAK0569108.1 hypothetical protein OC861_001247 [Tilletia horrida]